MRCVVPVPHLEDLQLLYYRGYAQWNREDDLPLIPSFVPHLQGRLKSHCSAESIVKAMVDLFGEVRFHYMDLVGFELQHLLYGCPTH